MGQWGSILVLYAVFFHKQILVCLIDAPSSIKVAKMAPTGLQQIAFLLYSVETINVQWSGWKRESLDESETRPLFTALSARTNDYDSVCVKQQLKTEEAAVHRLVLGATRSPSLLQCPLRIVLYCTMQGMRKRVPFELPLVVYSFPKHCRRAHSYK